MQLYFSWNGFFWKFIYLFLFLLQSDGEIEFKFDQWKLASAYIRRKKRKLIVTFFSFFLVHFFYSADYSKKDDLRFEKTCHSKNCVPYLIQYSPLECPFISTATGKYHHSSGDSSSNYQMGWHHFPIFIVIFEKAGYFFHVVEPWTSVGNVHWHGICIWVLLHDYFSYSRYAVVITANLIAIFFFVSANWRLNLFINSSWFLNILLKKDFTFLQFQSHWVRNLDVFFSI